MSAPSIAHIKYQCTVCKKTVPRDELTAKRISFQTMGMRFKTLRSRVIGWLCKECLEKDETWNMPKRQNAPGMKGTKADGTNADGTNADEVAVHG